MARDESEAGVMVGTSEDGGGGSDGGGGCAAIAEEDEDAGGGDVAGSFGQRNGNRLRLHQQLCHV